MINETKIWLDLQRLADDKAICLNESFLDDQRCSEFSLSASGLHMDYSKNLIDKDIINKLIFLLEGTYFQDLREKMFSGKQINHTEKRSVGHVMLRAFSQNNMDVMGKDIIPEVRLELYKMACFVDAVRSGEWLGYSGKPIGHIVNIGIGGSDLGPKMATEALTPYCTDRLTISYVSNVDGSQIYQALKHSKAETTLFIVCSKSFKTQETLNNATLARQWFLQNGGDQNSVFKHFCAVTSNNKDAANFGIKADQQFSMWDWVGGRFSLWSTVGLSTALMIGMDKFVELLEGAESMDRHFLKAPPAENMPVLLALLGVWYINFKKARSHAILPYDNYLRYFPEYMQQLDMESNGKRVSREGDKLDIDTSPVVWGTAGTNGQHAYFQLLHQGSQLIPADFILVKESHNPLGENHELLLTNGIAQMEALMKGRTREKAYSEMQKKGLPEEEIKSTLPYKVFPGNRPSTAIVLDKVTPKSLGALIALYEHKVFTQGVIWGLNSFDQWGVEYGKELASVIKNEVDKGLPFSAHDSSTRNLIEYMFPKI